MINVLVGLVGTERAIISHWHWHIWKQLLVLYSTYLISMTRLYLLGLL